MRHMAALKWCGAIAVGCGIAVLLVSGLTRRLVSHAPVAEAPPAKRLLLITIDTLRADRVNCIAGGRKLTPEMDALARQGVRFTRAYAHNVITLPSHCNILTGVYPVDHGVRDMVGFRLPNDVETLGTILKARGFSTAAFIGAYPLDSRFGLAPGFDVYDDISSTGSAAELVHNRPERRAESVVARFASWLDSEKSGRWFAWVHLYDPHDPYLPPEPYLSQYHGREYDGEVAYTDANVGRIASALRERNLLNDLAWIITADHGEALGDHGELTHGVFVYEEVLHVPLIVITQDRRGTGSTVDSSVQHVDILPTALDLMDIPAPAKLRGRSLVPLISSSERSPAPDIYFEAMTTHFSMGWAPLQGILSGNMKYIDLPIQELYDLAADPAERSNRAAAESSRTSALREQLDRIRATTGKDATAEMDQETLERLRSLGYVAGSGENAKTYTAEDDPKRLIDIANAMNEGLNALTDQQYERASGLFESAIRRRPGMALPYLRLALTYRKTGARQKAAEILQKAVDNKAATAETYGMLGLCLSETGHVREAIGVLEPAAVQYPDDIDIRIYLGMAYAGIGRLDLAVRAFQHVIDVAPDFPDAHANMGIVLLRAGDRQRAIYELNEATRLDPQHADAFNTLGAVYAMGGDTEQAVRCWKRVLELNQLRLDTIYNLAILYLRLGKRADARPYMEQFVRLAPPERYRAEIDELRKALAGN